MNYFNLSHQSKHQKDHIDKLILSISHPYSRQNFRLIYLLNNIFSKISYENKEV